MEKKIVVANWKSNKTIQETLQWLEGVHSHASELDTYPAMGIVCPSFTGLEVCAQFLKENVVSLHVGAQDISPFSSGAYTGAVNAGQIREVAEYVIIGHSERRIHFHETDEILFEKVMRAIEVSLTPIYCVSNENMKIPSQVTIVAYEPIEAIGTGNPADPQVANDIAKTIKTKNPQVTHVLYGGSVSGENIQTFTQQQYIRGVLVGGKSLEFQSFLDLLKNA